MTAPALARTVFETSRTLEYFTERELTYQTGVLAEQWGAVIVRELIENGLDAAEAAGVAPVIDVRVEGDGAAGRITVADNGPGLDPAIVARLLNFTTRTTDKEAYISPTRGAQGNALKTVLAIPYVVSEAEPKQGHVAIASCGVRHAITVATDLLRQEPRIDHDQTPGETTGTSVSVDLDYAGVLGPPDRDDFYKLLDGYALFNPHATFRLGVPGDEWEWPARVQQWAKWTPTEPTSPHWYTPADLERLIGAHVVEAERSGRDLPLREFVAQFRGLSSTQKQKRIAGQLPQRRLSEFVRGSGLDGRAVGALLAALQAEARPVKPEALGVLGEAVLRAGIDARFEVEGDCFKYRCIKGHEGGLPFVLEVAFARKAGLGLRQYIGLNWAPRSTDPFAELRLAHAAGRSVFASTGVRGLLAELKVQQGDPVVVVVHLAFPRPRFRDRGKSALAFTEGA